MSGILRGLGYFALRGAVLSMALIAMVVALDQSGRMGFFCAHPSEGACLSLQDLLRSSPVTPLVHTASRCDPERIEVSLACMLRVATPLYHSARYLGFALAYLLPSLLLTLLFLLIGAALRLYRIWPGLLEGFGVSTLALSVLPIFTLATLVDTLAPEAESSGTMRHLLAALVIVFADLLYRRCSDHVHVRAKAFMGSVPFRAMETRGADPWHNGWPTLVGEAVTSIVPQLPLYVSALTVAEVVLDVPGSLGRAVYLGYHEHQDLGMVLAAVLMLGIFWAACRQAAEWLDRRIAPWNEAEQR